MVTVSDSAGTIHDPAGIDAEKLAYIIELKNVKRGRIEEYAQRYKATFHAGKKPWGIKGDIAFPSATENEIVRADAEAMLANGVRVVAEGANMPTHIDAVHLFLEKKILFAPGKAANAGGVAVSGLEQSQNAMRLSWSREEVDSRLRDIMKRIHDACVKYGTEGSTVNYVKGANIGGFVKVADAMLAYGVV